MLIKEICIVLLNAKSELIWKKYPCIFVIDFVAVVFVLLGCLFVFPTENLESFLRDVIEIEPFLIWYIVFSMCFTDVQRI